MFNRKFQFGYEKLKKYKDILTNLLLKKTLDENPTNEQEIHNKIEDKEII